MLGLDVVETNLRRGAPTPNLNACILHYVPSGFINETVSENLQSLLSKVSSGTRLCVVLHGLHTKGETRFGVDGVCRDQDNHIKLIFQKATSIIALSDGVGGAWRSWRGRFNCGARFIRLDHPGLFSPPPTTFAPIRYGFIGGVSRPKKDHESDVTIGLVENCEKAGIRIWQHWTNVQRLTCETLSWRQTCGLVRDDDWGAMVAQARVVLCPYQTKIQAVSGIISEAISAGRFVLATSFESSLEMRLKAPDIVLIEDNLRVWPEIIHSIPSILSAKKRHIPTWKAFSTSVADELFEKMPENYSRNLAKDFGMIQTASALV